MNSLAFTPSGVVTFTTDFGHKGPFIGTMKGAVLSRYPDATLVDISHETSAHWPAEAGFWVSRSYSYFPKGTVHVAVVDPGVGSQRDIILVVLDGHCFLAPDNGLLASLVEENPSAKVYCLDTDQLSVLSLSKPSATFHGRDIFAPVAAELARGNIRPEDVGPITTNLTPSLLDNPLVTPGQVSGVVVTVDNFGNLITNIDESFVASMNSPVCEVAGHRMNFANTYALAKPGKYLALVNSFGVVEIARSEQSAALGLGLGRGAPVRVVDNTNH